ncbi:hypothetical protein B0J14DRAFT_684879 [Halenospora varia]|nr:hypothetical protein B0J14DRAFT_684879 [Halenospora varia]
MTHLGILFDPNIWSYAKGSNENVDKIAALFQADPQKIELLSILDKQVELLVKEGRPDLSRFLDEPVPQGCLDTAIDLVVEGLGRVLGKHPLGEDDSVMVNGAVEFSYGVLDRLRNREWLNCWDIAAALEMTDRPVFVQLGPSIPLHKNDVNGEVIPISDPLRRWRKKIDDYKRKGKNDLEQPQVHICPLNMNANHFTLLEINEQTKMIYHYDSMASQKIISRKMKSSLVRRMIEAEFKDLGFGYIEANTPQQKDGWSCGLMTVRNAKRRMMGLSVGTWNDEVDPDRVTMDVIGDFQTFLENDTLQPSRLSKKRKIVEGLQSSVPEPCRSSKRLRKTNGTS